MKKIRITAMLLVLCIVFSLLPINGAAVDGSKIIHVAVEFEASYSQTEARKVLKMINDFRTDPNSWVWNEDDSEKIICGGVKPLQYDYGLEKVAMQRAAELILSFTHRRTNGNLDNMDILGEDTVFAMTGENIAIGFPTAGDVHDAFLETNEGYVGQGHRRNMLQQQYSHTGLACVNWRGFRIWVEVFGSGESSPFPEVPALNGKKSVLVDNWERDCEIFDFEKYENKITVKSGEVLKAPTLRGTIFNHFDDLGAGFNFPVHGTLYPNWESSDPAVLQKNGKEFKAVAPGTVTLTTTCKGDQAAIEVTVLPGDPVPPTDDVVPDGPDTTEGVFADVPKDSYCHDAVNWAVAQGITNGNYDTHFSPDYSCVRRHVVMFLWRFMNMQEPDSLDNPFTDVKHDRFEKAILWAAENGITNGYSDGTFRPEDLCTRKQIVTFLWRNAGSPEPVSMDNPFPDVKHDQFEKAILWAAENHITTGFKDGSFGPEKMCTRGQIVSFLYRAQ